LPEADAALAAALGVSDTFKALPAVPYEHTLAALRRHDISLLSTAPGRDDIVPAKLWDYLAARRPILSLGQNPFVASLLETRGAGRQLDPAQTTAIAQLLEECVVNKARGEPLPVPGALATESLAEFEAQHLTERLAKLFDTLAVAPGG